MNNRSSYVQEHVQEYRNEPMKAFTHGQLQGILKTCQYLHCQFMSTEKQFEQWAVDAKLEYLRRCVETWQEGDLPTKAFDDAVLSLIKASIAEHEGNQSISS